MGYDQSHGIKATEGRRFSFNSVTLTDPDNKLKFNMPIQKYQPETTTEAKPVQPLSHYLPGTEREPYYTCKWCYTEIKNSYFKYLKHRRACPKMKPIAS